MRKTDIKCDLHSCELCEKCIYDEDYQEEENMNDNNKRETCNGCPFEYKLRISTWSKCYHNHYCKNNTTNTIKLIDLSVEDGKDVKTPSWCPINQGIKDQEFMGTTLQKKKSWTDIKPQMAFSEIKEGEVYHIPPYDNHARMDILITRKSEYSASYKILNEGKDTSYAINTLYPNTTIMRVITKHKIQNIEVKRKI